MRRSLVLVIALVAGACPGGDRGAGPAPVVAAPGPRLPPPQPIDPSTRGAAFLRALANHIQPRWGQFLEDCRLRLATDHPLNMASLTADVELVLEPGGKLVAATVTQTSGNSDFDRAALEVVHELPPTVAAPALESDDGRVHVHWVFARDRRQAGPATARVLAIELPLVATVQRLVERGALVRAAQRLTRATAMDGDRAAATELVMIAALREGLASSDGSTREAALETAGRAKLPTLAADVHRLIEANVEPRQRVLAITASAALGDAHVVPQLLAALDREVEEQPDVALAKLAALVALDHREDAARTIRAALARKRGVATAITALATAPDPALDLRKWLGRDVELRVAVCTALPAAAPTQAQALIARGLADADASVRAACAAAAARHGSKAVTGRLAQLARDRDELVRARAVAALGALREPPRRADLQDRSPHVRAAAATGATEADLRVLAADKDAEVRAAAVAAFVARVPERAPELALAVARDPASAVRRAAVAGITDEAVLEKLAGDDDPDVATAALGRYAQRRGRAAVTTAFLERLAASSPRSLERVRIARAWLLAR